MTTENKNASAEFLGQNCGKFAAIELDGDSHQVIAVGDTADAVTLEAQEKLWGNRYGNNGSAVVAIVSVVSVLQMTVVHHVDTAPLVAQAEPVAEVVPPAPPTLVVVPPLEEEPVEKAPEEEPPVEEGSAE